MFLGVIAVLIFEDSRWVTQKQHWAAPKTWKTSCFLLAPVWKERKETTSISEGVTRKAKVVTKRNNSPRFTSLFAMLGITSVHGVQIMGTQSLLRIRNIWQRYAVHQICWHVPDIWLWSSITRNFSRRPYTCGSMQEMLNSRANFIMEFWVYIDGGEAMSYTPDQEWDLFSIISPPQISTVQVGLASLRSLKEGTKSRKMLDMMLNVT